MSEILLVSGNPGRRRKHKAKHRRRHSARRRSARSFRKVRRVRRNPSFRSIGGSFMPTITGGLVGGLGGLANDALFGFGSKWLPDFLKTGIARHVVKIASAVAVGGVGGMVLKGKGQALAIGAASCAVRDALREQAMTAFPSLPLGDYDPSLLGYDNPAENVGEYMGEFAQVGMGEYMPG